MAAIVRPDVSVTDSNRISIYPGMEVAQTIKELVRVVCLSRGGVWSFQESQSYFFLSAVL